MMQTIKTPGEAEQVIQKSKFLAWAANCQSEKEAAAFLQAIAAQHQNASHLAFAYRIQSEDGLKIRYSDAGEPSGTAGLPIFQLLEGQQLVNSCVGVIRYYGGVNLGKGGLARAYGGTAKLALAAANIQPYVALSEVSMTIEYNKMDALTKAVAQMDGEFMNKSFHEQIAVTIRLPEAHKQTLIDRFTKQYG